MTSSTVNGTTTAHVYAGGTQQELTSAGSNLLVWGRDNQYGQPWLQSFSTGGASDVYVEHDGYGIPLGLHTGGQDYYLVPDNLGSVIAVVNTAGTVVARYTYDPYGSTVSADESGLPQPNIIRYTGGTLDLASGLTKLGQRYDNPALGAFTQQDINQLLASPQDGNLYAYAGDNPVSNVDPTGEDWNPLVSYSVTGGFLIGTAEGAVAIADEGAFTVAGLAVGAILGSVFAIGFAAIACVLFC